jgi:hypothetical protein
MKKTAILLSLIIGFALLIRLLFLSGPTNPDEFAYAQQAYNVISGQYDAAEGLWYGLRFVVFLPAAFFFKLFGVNDFALSAWPLLCSLINIFLIFALGKRLFDTQTGLLASLLLALFPLDILYATHLLPDSIMPLLLSIAFLLFLQAESTSAKKQSIWLYILTGITVGLGYLARETAVIFFILFLVFLTLYRKRLNPKITFIGIGYLTVLGLESWYYSISAGTPFLRWQLSYSFYQAVQEPTNFLFYPKALLSPLGYCGAYFYLFLGAIGYFFYHKKIPLISIPLLWLISTFFYLEFGTMSLSEFSPISKEVRYLAAIATPLVLITAYFLRSLPSGNTASLKKFIGRIIFPLLTVAFLLGLALELHPGYFLGIIKKIYLFSIHAHSFEENYATIQKVYHAAALTFLFTVSLSLFLSALFLSLKRITFRFRMIALLFCLLILPITAIDTITHSAQQKAAVQKYSAAYAFLKNYACEDIFCMHWRWPVILSYYYQYTKGSHYIHKDYFAYTTPFHEEHAFRYVYPDKTRKDFKNACLIVDREFLSEFLGSPPPPDWIYRLPDASWKKIFSFKDVTIYRHN